MLKIVYIGIVIMIVTTFAEAQHHTGVSFKWNKLPALPDKHGFAGSFAGVSNGCLVVAGGANFPDGGAPWTGSKKAWTDKIFVLESVKGKWIEAGKLPMPLGYGVSVTWDNQLICFGGSNAEGYFKTVLAISYINGKIKITKLTDMPAPLANAGGAITQNRVYIAGGLHKPDDKLAANNFWTLDLSKPTAQQKWEVLPTWPGPSRILSVAGTVNNDFYLFSGAALADDGKGDAKRKYLDDAYKYSPGKGWLKLAPMPYATVAAASPAFAINKNNLLVFGGDDGKLVEQANELKDKHLGFNDNILSYDIAANTWHNVGKIATDKKKDAVTNPNGSIWAPVTTAMAIWNNNLVFPGGEVRPAVRTPNVLSVSIKQDITNDE
jgi:N-acetylneuraminic acid mutarotase